MGKMPLLYIVFGLLAVFIFLTIFMTLSKRDGFIWLWFGLGIGITVLGLVTVYDDGAQTIELTQIEQLDTAPWVEMTTTVTPGPVNMALGVKPRNAVFVGNGDVWVNVTEREFASDNHSKQLSALLLATDCER